MVRKKLINALKVVIIFFLLVGIIFLAIIQWKSDVVTRKVIVMIQHQLTDTLRYDDVSLEWFRYFPCAALQLKGLQLGNADDAFMKGGDVDVVLRLFPLLQERVVINKIKITDGHLNIVRLKNKWSYELFKKSSPPTRELAEVEKDTSDKWEMLIRRLEFVNTSIYYDDRDGLSFSIQMDDGRFDGELTGDLFDTDMDITGHLDALKTKNYTQPTPFPFKMEGRYTYDAKKGLQQLEEWLVKNEGIELEISGYARKESEGQWMDLRVSWANADPQAIKKLLPPQSIKDWKSYSITGKSKGQLAVKGISSDKDSPHVTLSSELKNGTIEFPGGGGRLKNVLLDIAYDNGESNSSELSYMRANLRNGSFEGNSLTADMRIENLDRPSLDLVMKGAIPASLLNLFMDSVTWNFQEGVFNADHFSIKDLDVRTINAQKFILKCEGRLKAEKIRFRYNDDQITIPDGKATIDLPGNVNLSLDEFLWNKAKGEDIQGEMIFTGDQIDFELRGDHSQGKVTGKGIVSGLGTKSAVMKADWNIKGIEMKELLASFDNFDQTFITSDHLNGKADIWTHTIIPYNADGNIAEKEINVQAAIDIKDGRLKNLKTLEDFSRYVHMDDLRDIRFNQMRNYLKIEGAKVYLPVMFIQSSAINMSINGRHSFNHEILYHIKINAGQAAASKLKKNDPLKRLKPARKSGWINMYFVLSGTVEEVKYEQDQKQVISAFEQSSEMKENLRKYLVDRFGHDVYWIEPNEWEDIPEYR